MMGADDPQRTAEAQARISTLLCATHDGLDAAMAAYAELDKLVGPLPPTPPVTVSPVREDPVLVRRAEAALDAIGSRRRSVSERSDPRLLAELRAETDLSVAAQRLRALLSDGPVPLGQLSTLYAARHHTALDPLALGFGRLGQLVRSLGLITDGAQAWLPPATSPPQPDVVALGTALDAVLRVGALPVAAAVERLSEYGIATSAAHVVEVGPALGFAVTDDIITARTKVRMPRL